MIKAPHSQNSENPFPYQKPNANNYFFQGVYFWGISG